jgi:hypothetical protein
VFLPAAWHARPVGTGINGGAWGAMPWFPDFAAAVELARRAARADGRADPVGEYLAAVNAGDAGDLELIWPGEVVVHDPRAGTVRGHRQLARFVRRSEAFLAERHARVEWFAQTRAGDRAAVELLAHIVVDGRERPWPVAVVAESPDDRSVEFRTYLSERPIDGRRHVRPPLLEPGSAAPGDVVGRYCAALGAGDVDALVATFTADGYLQDPTGSRHTGAGALRAYFGAGGADLQPCATTDDGTRCALEYNRGAPGARQAGIAVFERAAGGLLAAVRVYDDVEPTR